MDWALLGLLAGCALLVAPSVPGLRTRARAARAARRLSGDCRRPLPLACLALYAPTMPRLLRPLIAAVTFIAAVTLIAGAAAVPAYAAVRNSAGPLLWTAPAGVDSSPIDAIACPSTRLCVAVDRGGRVLWSTNPAGGSHSWLAARVDGGNELTGLSCPSTGLCVAVDGAGNVITSSDPTGGPTDWTVAKIDSSPTQNNTDTAGPVLLRGVSCPSTGLCVAVDGAGNALESTNPTGGAAAWTITHADTNRRYGCGGSGLTCQPPLVGVSCPSTALCAAVDFSGNILTTQSPTAAGAVAQHAERRQSAQLAVGDLVPVRGLLRDRRWGRRTRDHLQPGGARRATRPVAARRAIWDLVPVAVAVPRVGADAGRSLRSTRLLQPGRGGLDLVGEQPRWHHRGGLPVSVDVPGRLMVRAMLPLV